MKLGVVSDVHNNAEALSYALAQLAQCDVVLSLGDLISDYRVTPEIIRLARESGIVGIKGNHEKTLFLHPGSRMLRSLADEDAAYLRELPTQRELMLDGRRILVAHGAPWDDPNVYSCHYLSTRDARDRERLRGVDADVVLVGHTHVATAQQIDQLVLLNPGSCGEARDTQHRLSYAELDFDAGVATVHQVRRGMEPALMLRIDV